LPKTLPEFFGALKVLVTLAFLGTNLVEIFSPHGRRLVALFKSGETNGDCPLMFAVLIALAVCWGLCSIMGSWCWSGSLRVGQYARSRDTVLASVASGGDIWEQMTLSV